MDASISIDPLIRRLNRAYMRAHRRDRNAVLGYLMSQTLLAFFVAYLLDRLTQFPAPVRVLTTLGILGGVLGWRLIRKKEVLRRKKDPEAIARDVENRARGARKGGFYSLIVSATEFGLLGRTPGSAELRQRVLTMAAEKDNDPMRLVLHRKEDTTRTAKWIGATVVVYVLWGVISPAAMGIFWARAAGLPHSYPTQTEIVSVEAPDLVARFEDITFKVEAGGVLPAQGVLEVQYEGSKPFEVFLDPLAENPTLYTAVLERPQRDVRYTVKLGDARGEKRSVRVVNPPVVGTGTLTVYPPEYTNRSPRIRPMGSFELWQGSRFDFEVTLADPVESCELILGDQRLPMQKTENGYRIESVTTDQTTSYTVRLVGEGGVENVRRAEFTVRVQDDEPPMVTLLEPAVGTPISPRSILRWKFEANDDLGMDAAILEATVIKPEVLGAEGDVLEPARTLDTRDITLADMEGATDLGLSGSLIADTLGLTPGTDLTLRIRVTDLYPERKPDEGWSLPVTLRVVSGQELKEILAGELDGAHRMLDDIRVDMERNRKAVKIRKDIKSKTGE